MSYVYAATGLFRTTTQYPKVTTCDGVALRTRPATSAVRKAVLPRNMKVMTVARVSGSTWSTSCNGKTLSGSSWYRITTVAGERVSSRYGVAYVYAATGVFATSTSTPSPTPNPTPTPAPTPGAQKTVTVASISALKSALVDNSVDVVVVRNGTYHVSPSNQVASDSLWIGSAASGGFAFDARTRPVTVRAETKGGVVFDGGGASAFGGLSFEDGAHDQTWDGFRFANMRADYTGIIEVGSYTSRRAPHHITLRNITIESSCTGRATTASGNTLDHAFYIGQALDPGPHDLAFEDITVRGEGNLATAFHFYHGADRGPTSMNAWNVWVRRMTVTGTQQALLVWETTAHDITFEDVTITNAKAYAIRYEYGSAIRFNRVTSTGSGVSGFYSSKGTSPAGVTITNSSLN